MVTLISFQANGEQIEHLGQRVAFYGLALNGKVLEYYTSVQAACLAYRSLEVATVERTETVSLKWAA